MKINITTMQEDFLISGPITPEIIYAGVSRLGNNTELGGHSVFIGQVRSDLKGLKKVKAIEYSAYEEMVKKEALVIKEAILKEFNDVNSIYILHSTGIVLAGEISLLVLVSAGHRHHAMDGCAKAVELIKEKLPVWKKEIFEDDTHKWVHDKKV
jgi:molybdopterin synthase catalytic subunit